MQGRRIAHVPLFLLAVVQVFSANFQSQFDPKGSSTFDTPSPQESFTVSYLDGSSITGYIGIDRIALGPYNVITQFGGITNSGWEWDGDGILGLGIEEGGVTPPLLKVLGGVDDSANGGENNLLRQPEVSLWMTETGGVLGLEGPILGSYLGNFTYIPVIPVENGKYSVWQIPMTAMRLGNVSLLSGTMEPTVIDSGSSCLGLRPEIYEHFTQAFANQNHERPPLFVTFGGMELEIDYFDYVINRGICVGSTPQTQLGDPFFRAVITLFNVDPKAPPKIGLAPRNRTATHLTSLSSRQMPLARVSQHQVEMNVTAVRKIRYFAEIAVGTPPQYFSVLIDTGSICTAVYSKNPNVLSSTAIILIAVGAIFAVLMLAFAVTFFILRRRWLKRNSDYVGVGQDEPIQLE